MKLLRLFKVSLYLILVFLYSDVYARLELSQSQLEFGLMLFQQNFHL